MDWLSTLSLSPSWERNRHGLLLLLYYLPFKREGGGGKGNTVSRLL